VTCEK
jgi:hypothetical protein